MASLQHRLLFDAMLYNARAFNIMLPTFYRNGCQRSLTAQLVQMADDDDAPSETQSPVVHPFDDEDADVVVVSCDKRQFRVYKTILGKASPVFRDMSNLPQAQRTTPSAGNPREMIDGLPVINLTEDGRTLELLFTLCYPLENPTLDSLDDVYRVLEASGKYLMDTIASIVRKAWPAAASRDPLRAFAIACTKRWEQEARIAARLALSHAVWPLEPPLGHDFREVSADTIVRLESYHRKCGAAANGCVTNPTWTSHIFDATSCAHCGGQVTMGTAQSLMLSDWYSKYTQQAAVALSLQPAGSTVSADDFVSRSISTTYGSLPCEASSHVMEKIKQVVTLFAEEIDKVVANVSIVQLLLHVIDRDKL